MHTPAPPKRPTRASPHHTQHHPRQRLYPIAMASLTMMASLSAVAPVGAVSGRVAAPRRGALAVARASSGGRAECQHEAHGAEEVACRGADGRRAVMFTAAAVALSAIGGGAAVAESGVKPGNPEAKKKYAQICVTMPTAKVCHN